MLRLSLLRHAKSSWDEPDLGDHERQLTKRGTKAACRIARYIADNDLRPDLILCSDAIRTLATLTLLRPALGQPAPRTVITAGLYLANPSQIMSVMSLETGKAPPGSAPHVMVIGHNPGLHALALSLSRGGSKRDLSELAMKYPTAALAHFILDIDDWSDLETATGALDRFITPRSLSG